MAQLCHSINMWGVNFSHLSVRPLYRCVFSESFLVTLKTVHISLVAVDCILSRGTSKRTLHYSSGASIGLNIIRLLALPTAVVIAVDDNLVLILD